MAISRAPTVFDPAAAARPGGPWRLRAAALALCAGGAAPALATVGCLPGTWSATGAPPCNPADPGYYVADAGATAQTPAPLGRYVAMAGQSSAMLAPLGKFVGVTAATAATQAPKGYYVDTMGATAPTPAPLGRYVDTEGAAMATLALPGYFVGTTGAQMATPAPVGHIAPNPGMAAPIPAAAGTYAPFTGMTAAQDCPLHTNSYGAATACRIVSALYAGGPPGFVPVTPVLGSNFGTGGSHDVGSLLPGGSFALNIANVSGDNATPGNLTALSLLSAALGGGDAGWFDLLGFSAGAELAPGVGSVGLMLQAKAGLPVGGFSFTLALGTDEYANYGAAGRQFNYTFTGQGAAPPSSGVPEPGSLALVLGALGAAHFGAQGSTALAARWSARRRRQRAAGAAGA